MKKDYIAIIYIMGGSSYGRADTIQEAVDNAARAFTGDWGSMFDVFGHECPVNVFDVTGFDQIVWDHSGTYAPGPDDNDADNKSGRHYFECRRVVRVDIPKLRKNGNRYGPTYRRNLSAAVAQAVAMGAE